MDEFLGRLIEELQPYLNEDEIAYDVCASRDKKNGWECGKWEVTTPLRHLRSTIRMFYCGIHIADMII